MLDIFSRDGLISFLYFLPALLLSLSIHEFSHSYVAYKLGDRSQKAFGRLTLNPIAHIDLWGFLCIALLGFGWGKPVIVNDSNFKNKSRDNMLVSLAGPASNFVIAILLTIILKILIIVGVYANLITSTCGQILISMILLTIHFNVVFAVFNMLPIPPFDGSKVLFYFLPAKYKNIMYTIEKYSFVIIIVFIVTNLASVIISPAYNLVINLINWILSI